MAPLSQAGVHTFFRGGITPRIYSTFPLSNGVLYKLADYQGVCEHTHILYMVEGIEQQQSVVAHVRCAIEVDSRTHLPRQTQFTFCLSWTDRVSSGCGGVGLVRRRSPSYLRARSWIYILKINSAHSPVCDPKSCGVFTCYNKTPTFNVRD